MDAYIALSHINEHLERTPHNGDVEVHHHLFGIWYLESSNGAIVHPPSIHITRLVEVQCHEVLGIGTTLQLTNMEVDNPLFIEDFMVFQAPMPSTYHHVMCWSECIKNQP